MSWCDYVSTLMSDSNCQDAAIVGYLNTPGVWAAHEGGCLSKVTPAEVKALLCDDRSSLFVKGVCLGGMNCSVIRDQFSDREIDVMDLKSKNPGGPSLAVVVARTSQTLVILIGKEGVHCGAIHEQASKMAKYLKGANY